MSCKPAEFVRNRIGDTRGFALMTVLMFAVVAGIIGLAFYAMVSWEYKGVSDRQHSTEAFYLAEAGIEQARGEFLEDNRWRGPINPTSLGSGSYTMSVMDTVVNGEDAVLLHSEGRVKDGARGIEVLGHLDSVLEVIGLFANRNFTANGNLTVNGHVHVNGVGDFGPGDVHLKGGTADEGYIIDPPPVYVHPDSFPNSSFYRVIGVHNDQGQAQEPQIIVYDHGSRTFASAGQLAKQVVTYDPGMNLYEFKFTAGGNVETKTSEVFSTNGLNSKFPLLAGDDYVVVDFGQPDSSLTSVADIEFNQPDGSWVMEATIINARFTGLTENARIQSCSGFWKGGHVTFGKQLAFAPRGCVALITNYLGPTTANQPTAQGKLGTVDNPALTYVTSNVNGIRGALEVHGVFVSLCDINSQGGPDVYHDPSVLDCIPQGVLGESGAGFLSFLEWREVSL